MLYSSPSHASRPSQAGASGVNAVFFLALSASIAFHVHAQPYALEESAGLASGIPHAEFGPFQGNFVIGDSPVHGFAPLNLGSWHLEPALQEALLFGQVTQNENPEWTSSDFWESPGPTPQKFVEYQGLAAPFPTPATKGPLPEQQSAGNIRLVRPDIALPMASVGTDGLSPPVTVGIPMADPILASGPTSVPDPAKEPASTAVPVPGDHPLPWDLHVAEPASPYLDYSVLPAQGTGSPFDALLDPRQAGDGPTEKSRAQFFCDLASSKATGNVPQSPKEMSLFKQAVVQQAVEAGRDEQYIAALTDMLARGDDGITWRFMYDQVGHVHKSGNCRTVTH